MAIVQSTETILSKTPQKFAVSEPTKLLTPIKGEPPVNFGKGRKRNPVITEIYNELLTNRNVWFHVNIPITSQKQLASLRTSLYTRARKDNMYVATSSIFNEKTKMFDLWVQLTA